MYNTQCLAKKMFSHKIYLGHLSMSLSKHYCDWQVWAPLQRKTEILLMLVPVAQG